MLICNFAEIQSPMLFNKQSTNLHSKKKCINVSETVVQNKKRAQFTIDKNTKTSQLYFRYKRS